MLRNESVKLKLEVETKDQIIEIVSCFNHDLEMSAFVGRKNRGAMKTLCNVYSMKLGHRKGMGEKVVQDTVMHGVEACWCESPTCLMLWKVYG